MAINAPELTSKIRRLPWLTWLGEILAISGLSFGLAWISSGFENIQGWASFWVVLALADRLLAAGWGALKRVTALDLPGWLGWLLLSAALLRLAAGAFWFVALPAWGYGSPVEQAGYVMSDAEARDQAAWTLSTSSQPLADAFRAFPQADQYGGLLYLSALVYRYLGSESHQPLLMITLTASFSALAVLFGWGFARLTFNRQVANWSAWLLALYPEAILLGSSQMREAFTITLAAMAFYGLARYRQDRAWGGLLWLFGALLACLPLSPPFSALLLGTLALLALSSDGWKVLRQRWLWLGLGLLLLAVLFGVWLSWERLAPQGVDNPIALIGWWLKRSAKWQVHITRQASGWMQRIFRSTPAWSHLPFLVVYGVLQPFLPAALLDDSLPIWRGIAVWRALGWTLLLPMLIAAPMRAWRERNAPGAARGLPLVVWLVILIASVRSGGDLWDNPRYRVAFAALQISLAAWVWFEQRRQPDPWFKRLAVGLLLVLAWFIPWYLRRYTGFSWPVVDLFKTVGLGLACAALFALWDWVRTARIES